MKSGFFRTPAVVLACFVVSVAPVYAQATHFHEVRRFEGTLANPKEVVIAEEERAILLDQARPEAALTLVDLVEGREIARVSAGEGPGQIRRRGSHVLAVRDSTIWVWQANGKQLSVYDRRLGHRATLKVPDGGDGLFPLDDSTALAMSDSPAAEGLLEYRWTPEPYDLAKRSSREVSLSAHSLLHPLSKNPMLRQGQYVANHGEAFIAFRFSSTIARVNSEGLQQVTAGEDVIPFPEYGFRRTGEGDRHVYQAPDITEHPIATMDLAVDDRYVYVLHHGDTFDLGSLSRFTKAVRGRMEAAVEEWELTDRLLIYNRNSLDFVDEWTLPHAARAIGVNAGHLYVLTTDEMPPTLITYRKPNVEDLRGPQSEIEN